MSKEALLTEPLTACGTCVVKAPAEPDSWDESRAAMIRHDNDD